VPGIPAYIWLWPNVRGTGWLDLAQLIVYLYILAGTLYVGLRRWRPTDLGLNRRGIGLGVACGVVLAAGRVLVVVGTDLPAAAPFAVDRLAGEVAFYFGVVALVEELLFRGLVYRALLEWRGLGWALWGSSFAFGLYHLLGHGPLGGLGTFLIGVVLACVRWRAGGIAGVVFAHGLIDVLSAELTPGLRASRFGAVAITSPALAMAGTLLIVGLPLYLWLIHPRVSRTSDAVEA
jgi:membrane protease YdiL (CAAX protease family)